MYDVVIVGAGPGGIFTAYELLEKRPDLSIAVFEMGNELTKRHCPIDGDKVKSCIHCKNCSIMSGFGGAGAFSDGKYNITNDFGGTLYEYIGKKSALELMEYVDKINLAFGGEGTKLYSTAGSSLKTRCMQNGLHLLDASVRHLGTDINYIVLEHLYDAFMVAMEQGKYKNVLNEQEKLTLEYLSKTVLSGVRPDELVILSQLLHRDHIAVADFIKEYQNTYGIEISTSRVKEAVQVLQGHFVSKEAEYQKYCQIDILENDPAGMIKRLQSYTERLTHIPFYTQVEDIIKVGIARYKEKYLPGIKSEDPFVLYEKYSRRDVSLLMNCGKDLSSIMYGMKRIENDVFIFITYHKEESQDEKNYVDGKPDYADAFEDNLIFKWDSQIGKGLDSSYMKDVLGADRKHLFVKKSDAETSFYYMGQFDVLEARNAQKEDNRGRMQPITKVTMKMHHAVREDLLRYLQSHITA